MLFMGIDVGTQGVRCIVSDEKGTIQAGKSTSFRQMNISMQPGCYEQAAEDWWNAATVSIKSCMEQLVGKGFCADEIHSISIDGTSGTIVPLDVKHQPLTNALMYNDMRAKAEALVVHDACGEQEKKLGLRFNASFSLPRILWVKNNWPEVYEKTAIFAHQADYIVGMLCGVFDVSDYSNALKTGYDLIANEWPTVVGTKLGIDVDKLPDIVEPGKPIAPVTKNAVKDLGLSTKTMVVGGSTDGYASALAAGAIRVGNWTSIIGTTFVLKGVTKNLVIDTNGSSYSHKLPSGEWMLGGAANIGGRCLNELVRDNNFAREDLLAVKVIPTGVRSYPLTGIGERFPFVDPKAEPFFIGDIYGGKLYAALLEGVGYAERLAYERMIKLGCEVGDVIYTSGGACRSDVWLMIRASILNRQLKVPAVVEAAMGSAILAAASYFGSLEKASEAMIHYEKVVDPAADMVGRYDEIYDKFYEECRNRYNLGE